MKGGREETTYVPFQKLCRSSNQPSLIRPSRSLGVSSAAGAAAILDWVAFLCGGGVVVWVGCGFDGQ